MKQQNLLTLLDICQQHPTASLVFKLGEAVINPNYHVTEIKHATVKSMDCGKGVDAWEEILVQLLDGPKIPQGVHMPCGKFFSIVNAATENLSIDDRTQTFIEFSPNNGPMGKLTIESIEVESDAVVVLLSSPTATCKAYDRAMAGMTLKQVSCC